MSVKVFFKRMGLEQRLQPVQKKLDKKIFYDNAKLNRSEKRVIANIIERIELTYLLTPSNINIQPFINEEFHYEGVMYITVQLREAVQAKQISMIEKVIHGSLPNPVVLIFSFNDLLLVSTCVKRLNLVTLNSVVLEEIHQTPWIDITDENENVNRFIEAISLKNVSFTNFFDFYNDIDMAVKAFQDVNIVGHYRFIKDKEKQSNLQSIIAEIKSLEREKNKVKAAIKKETQFNKKVDLNIELQKINSKIDELKTTLEEIR